MIIIPRSEFDPIIHPEFVAENRENNADIAILKLKKPIKFSKYVHPICLPIDENYLPEHFTMSFWTNEAVNSMDRNERLIESVDSDKCHEIYLTKGGERNLQFNKDGIKEQVIFCANSGYVPKGNSGGVATYKKRDTSIAYGILSMGSSKKFSLPSVFIDIRAYRNWIFNNI
ncbi:hypothetical protein ACKWTF_012664 [Chironomus riparius]